MARKHEKAAEAPTLSLKERLAQKSGQRKETATSKKKDREHIALEGAAAMAADRLCAASHAKKAIEGHMAAARALLLPVVKQLIFGNWVSAGRKLDNPQFTTPGGCYFTLQVKDTLTGPRGFRAPKDDEGKPIPMPRHLQNNGVPDDLIDLLSKDGSFKEETTLSVNMPKLEKEYPALGQKLMKLILAANEGGVTTNKEGEVIKFTDDDLEKIVEYNNDVTLKEGFLADSVGHVKKTTKDEGEATNRLLSLLTAVQPQFAFSQVFCANPDEGIVKLLHEEPPKPVVDENAPVVEHKTPDGKYTLRVQGTNVNVVRNSDNKEVGQKICKDAMHLANTLKKWKNDPAALAAFIAENV